MGIGERLVRAIEARGHKNIKAFSEWTHEHAKETGVSGIPATSLYGVKGGSIPKGPRLDEICALLKINRALLVFGPDEDFDADLASEEPEGRARQVSEPSKPWEVSHPVETWIMANGMVAGAIGRDTIDVPVRRDKLRDHAARTADGTAAEYIVVGGVPPGAEVVRVKEDVRLETGELLATDYVLFAQRDAPPKDGRLVIAKRDVNLNAVPTSKHDKPEVRLFRYHTAGRGWSIEMIDGSGKTFGSGDGWQIVAAVLIWRSPP